jgi:hypothetical protein
MGVPTQLFADGVMVNVTVTAALVVFVKAPLILPEPLEAIPVTPVLSLVQLKVVPLTPPVNEMGMMDVPEQMACEEGVATAFGNTFTTTSICALGLSQPLPFV